MKLDALLRAHAFMNVERPSEIWEADTEDVRFVPLLGEMIAALLSKGASLGDLTLNVSNVVVESFDDEGTGPREGEYVAVTVAGAGDIGPDERWRPDRPAASGLLNGLGARLTAAGAQFAYVRRVPPDGSITVFLARCRPASESASGAA